MRSAAELFEELNAVDESNRIEAKRASDVGKSVMETVIAFANEPGLGGGYLLLGAEWAINDKGDTVIALPACLTPTRCNATWPACAPARSTWPCAPRCNWSR